MGLGNISMVDTHESGDSTVEKPSCSECVEYTRVEVTNVLGQMVYRGYREEFKKRGFAVYKILDGRFLIFDPKSQISFIFQLYTNQEFQELVHKYYYPALSDKEKQITSKKGWPERPVGYWSEAPRHAVRGGYFVDFSGEKIPDPF